MCVRELSSIERFLSLTVYKFTFFLFKRKANKQKMEKFSRGKRGLWGYI